MCHSTTRVRRKILAKPNTQMVVHTITTYQTVMTNSDTLVERQHWINIPHACQVADVSPTTMRLLIKAGVLRACQLRVPSKVWGKWIINKESLLGYLDRLAANQRKVKNREEVEA